MPKLVSFFFFFLDLSRAQGKSTSQAVSQNEHLGGFYFCRAKGVTIAFCDRRTGIDRQLS